MSYELFFEGAASPEMMQEIKTAIESKDAAKIKEVQAKFLGSHETTVKTKHLTEWEKQHADNIRKSASTGSYKKALKDLMDEGLVTPEDYAEISKLEKDEIKTAVAKVKARHAEALKQYEAGKDGTVQELSKKLEEANKQIKELNDFKASVPTQIEQARTDFEGQQMLSEQLNNIIVKNPKNITAAQLNTLKKLALADADLKYTRDANGKIVVSIFEKGTQKPLSKSATEIYTNLEDFLINHVAKGNGLWAEQGNGGNGGKPFLGAGNGGGDKPFITPADRMKGWGNTNS